MLLLLYVAVGVVCFVTVVVIVHDADVVKNVEVVDAVSCCY